MTLERYSPLDENIAQRYKAHVERPYPTKDVARLEKVDPTKWGFLQGELVVYFATIAGYASDANRLSRRSKEKLEKARTYLLQPFFEKYPQFAHYRAQITPEKTPNLYREMDVIEQLRSDLLVLVEAILQNDARQLRNGPEARVPRGFARINRWVPTSRSRL